MCTVKVAAGLTKNMTKRGKQAILSSPRTSLDIFPELRRFLGSFSGPGSGSDRGINISET